MQALKRFTVVALAFLVICPTMLYFLQEKLIFLPTSLPDSYEYRFSAPFKELFLNSSDGARLNALHFKHEAPRGLILYFHGNAGNLSRWGEVVQPLYEKGYDVLIMDYRTYGKSSGNLSEEALYNDAQLFYDHVRENFAESDILLYGRSLGTGIASWLAAENSPGKLLLESPFYSLTEVASHRFPILPVEWLIKYRLESYKYLKQANCPVFIFHGTEDEVVPFTSGLKLYNSFNSVERHFFEIVGGGHNDLEHYPEYWKGLEMALANN